MAWKGGLESGTSPYHLPKWVPPGEPYCTSVPNCVNHVPIRGLLQLEQPDEIKANFSFRLGWFTVLDGTGDLARRRIHQDCRCLLFWHHFVWDYGQNFGWSRRFTAHKRKLLMAHNWRKWKSTVEYSVYFTAKICIKYRSVQLVSWSINFQILVNMWNWTIFFKIWYCQ